MHATAHAFFDNSQRCSVSKSAGLQFMGMGIHALQISSVASDHHRVNYGIFKQGVNAKITPVLLKIHLTLLGRVTKFQPCSDV